LVADSLPVLISYVDADRRYRFNNKAYEDWFGHKRKALSGKHLRDVLGDAAYDAINPMVDKVLAGERVSAEREVGYKDGGTRFVHIEYMPDRRDDGSVAGFYALVRDISESKRAEAELRESEARFRAMADSAPSPVWVTNESGIEFVNKAYVELAGLDAEALTGGKWMEIIHPDDLAEALALRARAWATGQGYGYDARFYRANGEQKWLKVSCGPRFDASNRLIGYVGMALDVTEAKRAEAELRESEARFRAMADNAPSPVWVTNADGIEFANRALAEFTGIDVGGLIGGVWMSLIHPDDLAIVHERRSHAWDARKPYEFEARFRRHDGEWRWLSASCNPREGPGGFQGYVGMALDVTESRRAQEALRELNQSLEARVDAAIAERERAEEALRQSQKMEAVGQLTGGIAHDFNNLLTVIAGNIDIARRHIGDEGEARLLRALGNAQVGAERAAMLTQRLLAFSRRQPLNPRPIDANKLVTGMSELLHRTLGETIKVETVLAAGLWRIEADPNQLENAILNLAVNARDAMAANESGGGGKLTIETANTHLDRDYARRNGGVPAGQYVVICVSDIGCGMSAETVARAFEPFFTTKDVGKGTGLGLSMAYGFVRQSGGHLKIYSEEGEGTTVRIYLPRLLGEEQGAEDQPVPAVPERSRDETILVCEDDDDVRAYTVEVLRELGYRVLEAHDGPSALRLLERQEGTLDLLFTDVVLPSGMTGDVLAREARARRPELKILFTTGYARDAIVHHGRLDPGVELITKPFAYADLAARVRDMLDRD
ncbi:MAG TPA: PAS domain S-box protein, partial [Allosphingosinicella sp.]|nr:PAS domain S-box protein [Allosphingosinicella sp.]